MSYKKKLIEVALPLEAINKESAREKSIRHGHPSTLHLWWARRPLAACRAVLFASLVDDPSSHPEEFPNEEAQRIERERLFKILSELVIWENSTNEEVLEKARQEILKSTDGNPPPVLDPFCGGGSIPLEAQRLGLRAYGSDLNPVAVIITKALIEIPPKFAGKPPVNPESRKRTDYSGEWKGAQGLAQDIRYYGKWMRDEAFKRIGHLYPKVTLPEHYDIAKEATVIAWLWARTVKCSNPACGATMPLVRSFWLSTKPGKKTWVEPVIDRAAKTVKFEVKTGVGEAQEGTVNRRGTRCLVCSEAVPFDHVRAEGRAGRMGAQMMAIVAEGKKGRIYLPPDEKHEIIAKTAKPNWAPETELPEQALGFSVQNYGLIKHRDLFTNRQLSVLSIFCDLITETREQIQKDAVSVGFSNDSLSLCQDGRGVKAYCDAVVTYLTLGIDRSADFWSSLCVWSPAPKNEIVCHVFVRQTVSMVWDYAEANPFCSSGGNFLGNLEFVTKCIEKIPSPRFPGIVKQADASNNLEIEAFNLVSTDPPYYDNIGYADLSDFFYIWMRKNMASVYPEIFNTLLVPKKQELIADHNRFGGDRSKAERYFLSGMNNTFSLIREKACHQFPLSIFYAFKQTEEDEGNEGMAVASTGWETMLEGLVNANYVITGTWPVRTERQSRTRGIGSNALASSIVLVCRPRPDNATITTRRELIATLRRELPDALKKLQEGNIAPVDFAQAAIGPGMAIYSRYSKVLEADGNPMPVRAALQVINQELDTYLAEQEGEFDSDTRFSIAWFEQYGMSEGPFGEADVLARAKNTSVEGVVRAGVLVAKSGKVRLLAREEYPDDWDPGTDTRLVIWECTQHLIKTIEKGGEKAAARLSQKLGGSRAEDARALAYRLYAICERKKWSQDALAYNMLVSSWSGVQDTASRMVIRAEQLELI